MIVKAIPGLLVPKEDQPREYITQDEEVDVPDSAYYLRRVADGDLVRVSVKPPRKINL
jgi:hypothetical protein